MLLALSAAMLLPAAADAFASKSGWQAFITASLITFVFGAALSYSAHCRLSAGLTLRQAFLLTPFAWTTVSLFGALPFYFSDFGPLSGSLATPFSRPRRA
jgi:trk system potassium uptake protein